MIFGLPLAVAGFFGIITVGAVDNIRMSQTHDMAKCAYPGAVAKSKDAAKNERTDNVPSTLPANVRVCPLKNS